MQVVAHRIVVLGTGGTIAGRGRSPGDHVGYTAGEVAAADLLAGIPVPPGCELGVEQIAQIDSKDMEPAVWASLVDRCIALQDDATVRGIVVTHGTDTLEETALVLHRLVRAAKPVVLTCAMRPATALSPDGPQNLADALVVAAHPGARGVVLACAGRVHRAPGLRKVHPYRLDPFESGEGGVVANVEDRRVRVASEWPDVATASRRLPLDPWPWVEIVASHAAARATVVDVLVRAGVQGLVIAGTGNGTVHAALEAALVAASESGVRVVRSTRCAEGAVIPHAGDRWEASPYAPAQARVDLCLRLLGA